MQANLWFYGGVLFFGLIVFLIPEPSTADAMIKAGEQPMPDGASKDTVKSVRDERKQRKEVLMSGIVTALGAFHCTSGIQSAVVMRMATVLPGKSRTAEMPGCGAVVHRNIVAQFSRRDCSLFGIHEVAGEAPVNRLSLSALCTV